MTIDMYPCDVVVPGPYRMPSNEEVTELQNLLGREIVGFYNPPDRQALETRAHLGIAFNALAAVCSWSNADPVNYAVSLAVTIGESPELVHHMVDEAFARKAANGKYTLGVYTEFSIRDVLKDIGPGKLVSVDELMKRNESEKPK